MNLSIYLHCIFKLLPKIPESGIAESNIAIQQASIKKTLLHTKIFNLFEK